MLRKFFFPFALVLLFAIGQQGALLHEISHVADYSPAGLTFKSNQQDKVPHSPVCDKCLGYAQLGGTMASSHFVLPVSPAAFVLFVRDSASHYSLSFTSYSARAPPLHV